MAIAPLTSERGAGRVIGWPATVIALDAKQFKQRPYKNITADREEVDPEEAVPPGGIGLRQVVKQADHLLNQHLETAGDNLEAGDRKDPDQRRRNEQDPCYDHARNKARVDVFQAEEAHLPGFVQNGVPHRLLDRFGFGARTDQDGRRRQQDDHGNPDDDENLLFLRFHRHLLLVKAARGWTGPRGRRLSGLPPGSRPDREAAVSCLGKRGNQFCLPWH